MLRSKGPVAARLKDLRGLARKNPDGGAEAAWEWLKQLGDDRAHAELDQLFALGNTPKGLDGATEGILVAPFIESIVDRGMTLLAHAWLPWDGKRFDAANNRGDNLLKGSSRYVAKLFWPRYSTRDAGNGERSAFDFVTRVERGKLDPGTKVLVIDYEPIEDNPDHLIRHIRDELVEIVPGANLGKILHRSGEDEYRNLGFFALRPAT